MVENKSENKNRYEWQIKSNNLKDILKKIDDISNVIINNFSHYFMLEIKYSSISFFEILKVLISQDLGEHWINLYSYSVALLSFPNPL